MLVTVGTLVVGTAVWKSMTDPPPRRSPEPPYLHQSPPPPSPSSSPLMTGGLEAGSWLQFAAQPVSPQMLLVSNDQIQVNILISAVKRSICYTISFHNHGESP